MSFTASLKHIVEENSNRLLSIHPTWTRVQLGDVSSILNGFAFPSGQFNSEDGTPLIRIRDILRNETETYFSGDYESTYVVEPGELVVGMDGDFNSTLWAGRPALLNQRVCKISPDERFYDRRFLAYALPGYLAVINAHTSAITVKHLSSRTIAEIPLPLPPLNEQRRIVAKIEELFSDLDAGVAALERAKAKLKRYRAAVLKAAVEGRLTAEWRARHAPSPLAGEGQGEGYEPASKLLERILKERRRKWEEEQLRKYEEAGKQPPKNWKDKYKEPQPVDESTLPPLPEGWCWASLDQILTYLRNGYFQSPSKSETGTPILRINAVRPMAVDLAERRYLDEVKAPVDDFFIEDGDLLFTRYNGSVDLLGVAGMVRGCTENVLHPDKLIRVKLAVSAPLSEFAEIAANVGESRRHMRGRARTTAGQTGISGTDIRQMPIPLAPLSEQSAIIEEVSEKLTQIEAAEQAIVKSLARASRLRQSILKRAFEGRLVPQDPNDEPASELLTRLRAESNGKLEQTARTKTSRRQASARKQEKPE